MGGINVKVRAYTGQGSGSGVVQWWTKSDISHVSLVFDMGHKIEEIEAIQRKGVICHKPYTHDEKIFVEYDIPLTYEQVIDAHAVATGLIGAGYDWKAIFSFIQHRKVHSLDKWMCAEFDAYVLLKAGYPLSRRSPHLEVPSTICESLRITEA